MKIPHPGNIIKGAMSVGARKDDFGDSKWQPSDPYNGDRGVRDELSGPSAFTNGEKGDRLRSAHERDCPTTSSMGGCG